MVFPSPGSMLLQTLGWLAVNVGAVYLTVVYGTPFLEVQLARYFAEPHLNTVVTVFAVLLAIQSLSVVAYIKSIVDGLGNYSVANKHVLITGGSQGLGLSLAKLCLKQGARVTIVSRTEHKLKAACEKLCKHAPSPGSYQVRYEVIDLSKATAPELKALMINASSAFGRVDVVFANAGFGCSTLVVDADPSQNDLESKDQYIQRVVNLNLMGTLRTVTSAADLMVKDGLGGRICIVSSAAGLVSTPGYAFYSATKFAHRGFVDGAYEELRHRGVLLSVYFPGTIETPGHAIELQSIPPVTQRIEAQCSDIDTPDSCAATLLHGVVAGKREIANELLFTACTYAPTGNVVIDAMLAGLISIIRSGLGVYTSVMVSQFVQPKYQ
jgi:NAD(P)-dependent dehydrogenase (short-subunit alcohol dehydrogenase family)